MFHQSNTLNTTPLWPSFVPQQQTWCQFCCPPSVHLLWDPPPTLLWGRPSAWEEAWGPSLPRATSPCSSHQDGVEYMTRISPVMATTSGASLQREDRNARSLPLRFWTWKLSAKNCWKATCNQKNLQSTESTTEKEKNTPQTKIKLEFPSLSPDQARLAKAPPDSLQEQAVSFP